MDIAKPRIRRTRQLVIYSSTLVLVVAGVAVGLGRLRPAAPAIEASTLVVDSVRRGEMVRDVRGTGTLAPEQPRYISASTSGRIERVLHHSGDRVGPTTLLLGMSNPDVELQALVAEQQLASAEAQLVSMGTSLETQRLAQESVCAQLESEIRDARRTAAAAESLAQRNLISSFEHSRADDRVEELQRRVDIEQRRLSLAARSVDSQIVLQRGQVERLRAIARFQRGRVASMNIAAGAEGALQDLSVEVGQWVQSGQQLAKVVQPDHLKAVLRIPETQAAELALGQKAFIDTRNGLVRGHVARIAPAAQGGYVSVDVAFDEAAPAGTRPDLSIEGTIEIDRLRDAIYLARPAYSQAASTISLFRVAPDRRSATRVFVRLGRGSASSVEVLSGLRAGDRVVLSDMAQWDDVDRIRLR